MADNNDAAEGTFPAYDAQPIETKWQRVWEEEDLYKTDTEIGRAHV